MRRKGMKRKEDKKGSKGKRRISSEGLAENTSVLNRISYQECNACISVDNTNNQSNFYQKNVSHISTITTIHYNICC
jgi:hypothetical protein